MRNVLLYLLLCLSSCAFGQRLDLSVTRSQIVLGQDVSFHLSITDFDAYELLEIDSNHIVIEQGESSFFTKAFPGEPSFSYRFHWTPKDTGTFYFGPYSIDFQGQHLVSDSVKVTVRSAHPTQNFIRIQLPARVKAGEEFEVVCSSSTHNLKDLQLEKVEWLEVKGTSQSNSMNFVNGEQTSNFSKTFRMVVGSKGDYMINEQLFTGLGEARVIDTAVKVR